MKHRFGSAQLLLTFYLLTSNFIDQSATIVSPGRMGRVRGSTPLRARLPTNTRMPRKMASFRMSNVLVSGRTFQKNHKAGCAMQAAHTEP